MLRIREIRVEDLKTEIVTDNPNPSVSCSLESDQQNVTVKQTRCRVYRNEKPVWDSGIREDGETINLRYEGEPLLPFSTYLVKVWVKDSCGETAAGEVQFETGKMNAKWEARWITDASYHFYVFSPKPMVFRKSFQLSQKVKSAKIYATAFGIYELELNGRKVGKDYFAPGYTSYRKQMQYQTYDVTGLLKAENTVSAVVAGGWAVGDYSMLHRHKTYENRQALLMEIRITQEDGSVEVIGTDDSWDVSEKGNWRYADFYNGEIYDARIDCNRIDYKKADIARIKCRPKLMGEYGSPVRRHETMTPQKHWKVESGGTIYDFGQNFAGVISAKIRGKSGQKIVFRHAEICMDGDLYTKPLRWAKARAVYTCRDGLQVYSPRFTYMGFRYVKVEGIDEADLELNAYALYSDLETTGSFECSNPDVNRLQQNICWSGKSNFMDIPTDCPQRDERMGWTGDIAVFAGTASFNFRMKRFWEKWLLDVIAEQGENGGIPDVVPHGKYGKPRTTDCWADCCVLVPWASYMAYGDKSLLRRQYNSMKKHIEGELRLAREGSRGEEPERYIWRAGYHWGDWCAPGENKKQWKEKTPWVATSYMANSCQIMSRIADELGNQKDAAYYRETAEKIGDAYRKVHTDGNGKLHREFQTGYVLPLYFGMSKESEGKNMADNLAALVEKAGNHLATGFCGTPYLLFALSDHGHPEKAYELLLQDTCPSWLYEVKTGGTTVWERWDALRPDSTVNQRNNMVSFNHYAYGAVGDWLYRRTAGIEAVKPAYREFTIKPLPGGGLTWAKASIQTSYGEIASNWEIIDRFYLRVKIPVNTRCRVVLPDGTEKLLGSGEYAMSCNAAKA